MVDMTVEEIVKENLPKVKIMQLATSINNQPWICNLHFCTDESLNIYWLSETNARHSIELSENSKVASTVKVHENTDSENYLIGISAEGTAEIVTDEKVKNEIAKEYISKHETSEEFIDKVLNDLVPIKFYKLKPKLFVLFDTKNFPKQPRQEWIIKNES